MTAAAHALPELNDVIPLARTLARSIAHRDADVDDLIQTGLFAYHKDLPRHNDKHVRDPWALARTILQRSMVAYYYYSYPKKNKFYRLSSQDFKRHECIDEGVGVADGTDVQESLFDRLALEDYYQALEAECGCTARVLAQNLVTLQDPCITSYILSKCDEKVNARQEAERSFQSIEDTLVKALADTQFSEADYARLAKTTSRQTVKERALKMKRMMQQRARRLEQELQEHRDNRRAFLRKGLPRGGGKLYAIRVTHAMVGEAMGLSAYERARIMEQIRTFTKAWLVRTQVVTS